MSKEIINSIKQEFAFSGTDAVHAALSVVPAVVLISMGYVIEGLAFTIGTLPTLQLGVAPQRKQRIVFSILGCLFGVGIFLGSIVAQLSSIFVISAIFFGIAFLSAVVASRRPVGVILLAFILPALSVGLGFGKSTAFSLFIAFAVGSLWSGFTALFWPVTDEKANSDGMKVFVAENPVNYGVMLGLAAATAVVVGHYFDPQFAGWTATATLLIMRPLGNMVKTRGFWRALATILGGIFAVVTIQMALTNVITAGLVLSLMVLIIGTRKSGWWLMPMGTAFFILTLTLYGETDALTIQQTGMQRIADNVLGAIIALIFGLAIPLLLQKTQHREI